LDLDQSKHFVAGIAQPMHATDRDEAGPVGAEGHVFGAAGGDPDTIQHDPVLRAAAMELQREAAAGRNDDLLDEKAVAGV
jgi:hypothetical protein